MKRVFAILFLALFSSVPARADEPRDALAKARATLDALSSYHLRLDDAIEPTDIDYTAPDKLRIRKPGSVGIIVGGGAYINVGGAGWAPSGVNTTLVVLTEMFQQDTLLACADTDEVLDQGSETLGGVGMRKYEIRTPADGSVLRRTVWIGAKDGLPRRVERSGGATPLTASYSEFNQRFGIEVPPGMQPAAQQ